MHKKSIGFNWGPCAVSTGYWTGVRMSTLLKLAGVHAGEGSAAAYVSFRGPKGELPKGDGGSYGELCLLERSAAAVCNSAPLHQYRAFWARRPTVRSCAVVPYAARGLHMSKANLSALLSSATVKETEWHAC